MEIVYGQETVHHHILGPAKVQKAALFGGTYQGNDIRNIIKVAASLTLPPAHELSNAIELFVAFNSMIIVAFVSRVDLTDDDIDIIESRVESFVSVWQEKSHILEITEPLKLHLIASHTVEFCIRFRATPAAYGEQDGESLHHHFKDFFQNYKSLGASQGLLSCVRDWNAAHF